MTKTTAREMRELGLCTEHDGDHYAAPCCGACDFLCTCTGVERDEAAQALGYDDTMPCGCSEGHHYCS